MKQQGKGDVKFNEFIKDMSFKNLEFLHLQHRQDVKVLSGGDLDGDGKDDDGKDDDGKDDEFFTFRNSIIRMDVLCRAGPNAGLADPLISADLRAAVHP